MTARRMCECAFTSSSLILRAFACAALVFGAPACAAAPDCGTALDAAVDVDAPRSCPLVAAAYEGALLRLGCSRDWNRCPVIATDEDCVRMFAEAPTCGALDSFASTCSRLLP